MRVLSWRETRDRIHADRARVQELLAGQDRGMSSAVFHPSFVSVALYRVSNHCYRRDHRWLARLIWHLNLLLTGADLSAPADIDAGLLLYYPPGVSITGTAGRNLTVMACSGMGGEIGRVEDIGAGPGLPVVGDDVVLEPHSSIWGPITVGNRVRVEAGTALTQSVPDDTVVLGLKPRFIKRHA
jgi:serine O-acetyltransferase